jgi:hypothetical protein
MLCAHVLLWPQDLMMGAVIGKLDSSRYPAVAGKIPESMEVAKAVKHTSANRRWAPAPVEEDDDDDGRNRLIVFIPGVVGLNEIRCAHEISEQFGVDVYIGKESTAHPLAHPTYGFTSHHHHPLDLFLCWSQRDFS